MQPERLPPSLAAAAALLDLQTASERLGGVVAEALTVLDHQVVPDPRLRAAVSEAVHQAREAERALVAAHRAVAESVGQAP